MENQLPSTHAKPLSLVDMTSAFVVLCLGISFSIVVFLLELIYKRVTSRIDRQKRNNKSQFSVLPAAKKETNEGHLVVTDVKD